MVHKKVEIEEDMVIVIPESDKILRQMGEKVPALQQAMEDIAWMRHKSGETFWGEVHRKFPGTEGWAMSYNHHTGEITCLRKKHSDED
jgi:hypothetical protein